MTGAGAQAWDSGEPGCAPAPGTASRCGLVLGFLLTSATLVFGTAANTGGQSGTADLSEPATPDTAASAAAAADTANRELVPAKARLTPKGALWRSALVPGWGQLRNRRYFKAVLFSGAAAAFAAAGISETRNLGSVEDQDRQAAAGRRNTRLLLFIATATFSALDAYVDAHLADFGLSLGGGPDLAPDLSLTWKLR